MCGCPSGDQNCSGKCADLTSDPKNCGSCGHSCLGGTCSGSVCQPWVIAQPPSTSTVEAMLTDGTNVVWLDAGLGKLLQMAAAGGSVIPLDTGTETATSGWPTNLLSLGGGRALYFGSEHGGGLALATLGSASSGTYVQTLYGTWGMLNQAGTRYMTNTTANAGKENMIDCPVGGGTCASFVFPTTSANPSSDPFSDNTYAFVIWNNQIFREPVGTGAWTSIETPPNGPAQLASDGTYLYWIGVTMVTGPNQVIGNVYRTPEASPGTPQLVTTGVSLFATDGASVYFPDGTATHMQSVSVGGGSATQLFPITGCSRMALAGTLLVWLNGTTNTIYGAVLP
jgi:hypothetical protein